MSSWRLAPLAYFARELCRAGQPAAGAPGGTGRSLDEITLSLSIQVVLDSSVQGDELEYRVWPEASASFVGSPRQTVATLRRFERLGVSHVTLNLTRSDSPGTAESRLEAMRIIATDVMPSFEPAVGRPS